MDHFIFFVFLAFIVFSNAHLIARKKRPVLKEKRPLRIRPKMKCTLFTGHPVRRVHFALYD